MFEIEMHHFYIYMIETLTNLDNALERTFTTLANRQTGLGTVRDKSQSLDVNLEMRTLSEVERNILFRSSNFCKKVVTLFPLDASRNWIDFTSDEDSFDYSELHSYFENLLTGSLQHKFTEASIEARLHGDAYILLGIDDGEEWDQPVNLNRIKTIRWAEVLYTSEVTPDYLYGLRPIHYWISTRLSRNSFDLEQTSKLNAIKVHHTRIIRLTGYKLYGSALELNGGLNDSVLQPLFGAFCNYTQAVMSSSAMMADYNVFKYKLKGLASAIKRDDSDAILQRFLMIQLGMGITKGLAVDADNEDAEFISRNYGGVQSIVEVLLNNLVAETDIPKYKLLNESKTTGIGNGKADQERFEWASLVKTWQVENWLEPLKYIMKLSLLAKDGVTGGVLPKNYGVKFNSIYELSPLEEQEMRLKKAEEHSKNISIGIYTKYEARMSTYGEEKWNGEVTLDDRISKKMEKEMLYDDRPEDSQAPKTTSQSPPQTEEEEPEEDLVEDSFEKKLDIESFNPSDYNGVSKSEFDDLAKINSVDILELLEKITEV